MRRSLRSWLWRVPIAQEVEEEIAFHLEMRMRELIAQGMDPATARETVLARAGDLARLKQSCIELGRKRDREMRLTQWLEEFRDDVTFAIRQLKAVPAFTAVAALTLALGIGANSAIFALADAALLRPLPYADADRLVLIDEHGPQQNGRSRVELLNFREWIAQNRTFDTMAAIWIPANGGGPTLTGADGVAEMVSGHIVTPRFFDVFGVKPILGRTFRPDDDVKQPDAVVLSERFWRRRFGGDTGIIGRVIPFEENPTTVIGIVPEEFEFTVGLGQRVDAAVRPASVWRLLPLPREDPAGTTRGQCGNCRFLQVVGRVKPGVSIDAARADVTQIAEALGRQNGAPTPRRITMTPMREVLIGRELRLTSILLLGVVGFVLLLCCANVANLVLARATVRARELAVRAALGAGRRRIVGQLLTESLVLAAIGGVLGVGLAAAILAAAPALIPAGLLPDAIPLRLDARVLGFCALMTAAVGLLFGLAPAWQATGTSLVQAIASEGRTATARGGRLRSILVAGEVAVAVLVLCGAGLLLRTLLVVEGFEQGYRAERERVLTVDFALPGARYATSESQVQFYDAVEREVMALPDVRSAGWATTLPLGGSQIGGQLFEIVGDPPLRDDTRPQAGDFQIVSPGYFRTIDLPIVAGRAFTDEDRAEGRPVCIVSEGFVRRHLAGRNPIGVRIRLGSAAQEREIVGVARQVKERPDEREELVQIYVPHRQVPWAEAYLLVRARNGDGDALTPAVRQAITRIDRQLAVRDFVTLAGVASEATAHHRFRAVLVSTFAGLALLLATAGIFGVLAYSVQQRWREFGVRMALGATAGGVLRLVASSAARLVGAGAVIGLAAAAAFGQLMSSFLFGVDPLDLITYVCVAILIAATAAMAAAAPALRAASVDPVEAFRAE